MFDSCVILLSGGPDSALLLQRHHAACKVAVWVDYGQPSRGKENIAARAISEKMGVPFKQYKIDGFLKRNIACVPGTEHLTGGDLTLTMGAPGCPSVIPARNMMLLSVAASTALLWGAEQILIGCCQDDHADYLDCSPSFVMAASNAFDYLGVRAFAPLGYTPKSAIMAELEPALKALSVSCYRSAGACGECNACVSRANAEAAP